MAEGDRNAEVVERDLSLDGMFRCSRKQPVEVGSIHTMVDGLRESVSSPDLDLLYPWPLFT